MESGTGSNFHRERLAWAQISFCFEGVPYFCSCIGVSRGIEPTLRFGIDRIFIFCTEDPASQNHHKNEQESEDSLSASITIQKEGDNECEGFLVTPTFLFLFTMTPYLAYYSFHGGCNSIMRILIDLDLLLQSTTTP
mmetsp:Transcript_44019/g.106732  ORF Transcript_44019/g.106732 Transcript_44019/m.106732 type:complete len:137 (+) Transcript_44019:1480-1890(+)